MKYLYDFFSSTNCRAVILLCLILLIHAYMKFKEKYTELKNKRN